jgi:antitoxin component YwqK of YwqJK toxin-antitoxin module
MKGFLVLIVVVLFACNNEVQYSADATEILSDSGFTNRAAAKNLMVNGLKQGKWVEYYNYSPYGLKPTTDTGAPVYYLTIYNSGKQWGMVRGYKKNGTIICESPYSNGKLNGISKHFLDNGKIGMEGNYINDTAVGLHRFYYNSGKLKSEITFVNGTPNGISKSYYESGALQCEAVEKNGKWESCKMYYENGKLKLETIDRNDSEISRKNCDSTGHEIK